MPSTKGARRKSKSTALVTDDGIERLEYFLDLVADGTSEVNAALEAGWTPKQLRMYMQDPDIRDLVVNARDRADGTVQHVLYRKAVDGNMMAITLWLKSRRREEWGDSTQVTVRHDAQGAAMAAKAVRDGVLAVLNQVGPQAMQALPAVIDAEVVDGED